MKDARIAELIARARAAEQPDLLIASIPYVRMLGLRATLENGELVVCMPRSEHLIGNPVLPALHGGTVGALLESAAILQLMWQSELGSVPKTITLTIDYLRSARLQDTFARATITRLGRRVANVHVSAFQESEERPVAAAHAHFLLRPKPSE